MLQLEKEAWNILQIKKKISKYTCENLLSAMDYMKSGFIK
jgi:hypothetical protein